MAKKNKGEESEEKAGDGGKEGGSKTLLIIIIAGFVLFLAVAGAGFYILLQKMPGSGAAAVTAAKPVAETAQPSTELGPLFPMKPFVINLAGDQKRFLRVKMDLELKDQATMEQVRSQLPRVKDKILTILSSKKFQDINTVEGKNKLRAEISTAIDALYTKGTVTNVYLTDFVVE